VGDLPPVVMDVEELDRFLGGAFPDAPVAHATVTYPLLTPPRQRPAAQPTTLAATAPRRATRPGT
jgi:hypothetical protein